jgi:hypothetical protein
LSFLDYARQANVQLAGLTQDVQSILAAGKTDGVDTQELAKQIVAGFVAKLQSV